MYPLVNGMPYVALYREWRPKRFSEVVGQDHVTVTLQNALRSGKIGHAYLFAGPRGTGKTSVAKILARAVNCANGPAPEPCNECSPCRRILEGSETDVIEVDAASNRGIDEIRDLRNNVRFCPAEMRYKVYIVDEVHMLTQEAFNALLKTLEEPPQHAIFVLATTEPHKIPPTVLSRCQRFTFHRIAAGQILARLDRLREALGVSVSDEALRTIARAVDGSLRDALSILDQCVALGDGEVSISHVRAILGLCGAEGPREVAAAVKRGDAAAALRALDRLATEGRDFRQVARELTRLYRNMMVLKVCSDPGDLVDEEPEALAGTRELAAQHSEEEILDAIRVIEETEGLMKYSSQPRVCLEIGVLKLAGKNVGGRRAVPMDGAGERQTATPQRAEKRPEPTPTGRAEPKGPGDDPAAPLRKSASEMAPVWQAAMARLKKERKATVAAYLEPARPLGVEDGCLILGFGPEARFHMRQAEQAHNVRALEAVLKAVTGLDLRVKCVAWDGDGPAATQVPPTEGAAAPERAGGAAELIMEMFGGKIVGEETTPNRDAGRRSNG
jgi:DNA polymerase-3 subunit gamma/tau